jgi:hypothetical protein
MQECKWCSLARELSKDETGHSKVGMCRPCWKKQYRPENKDRKKTKKNPGK